MHIYRLSSKDDVTTAQNKLQKDFLPSDTWGEIDVHTSPEQAEKDFCNAICSEAAEKEQRVFEHLAQQFPDKYGHIVPTDKGKTAYSVFPTAAGARILFVTRYAQKPVKKIFTTKTMGSGVKIHTAKIRNRFEPISWRRASWFFVAHALIAGKENEFSTVSRYS